MYIENINGPADVKKLNIKQMTVLASEIRDALLTKLAVTAAISARISVW